MKKIFISRISIFLILVFIISGCGGGNSNPKVNLTITKSGNGTVTPLEGIHQYNQNTVVNLLATPEDGWSFGSWVGENGTEVTNNTILMNGNKSIQAIFNGNLLANPGFETNDTWEYNTYYGERDTTSPHNGSYCIKFQIGACYVEQYINSGFTPGDSITARYWGFLSGTTESTFIRLIVEFNDVGNSTDVIIDSTNQVSSYTKFEQSITIPNNTTSIRVYITGIGSGNVYADDIFVGYEN